MCPRIAPSPSRASERLKEYLDIFDSTKAKERGKTLGMTYIEELVTSGKLSR